MKVAVIGGTAGMGKTLIHFFRQHKVLAVALGRKTKNPDKILKFSDVIVVSIPSLALKHAVNLLKEIDLSKKLLISLGSIMTFDRKMLFPLKKVHLLHMHQLFGPTVFPFTGYKVVISGETRHKSAREIIDMLKKDKVTILKLKPEEHDNLMASVQAMSQFSAICLAKTLSESGNKKNQLCDISTVTFRMTAENISRIMAQKADLWAFLQFENPNSVKLLEKHVKNAQSMLNMAKNKDYKKFEQTFKKAAKFWK